MSQSGLLNEDEIRDFLNENFGLKLDRNALIKPTSDVVIEIYTRFLESCHCKWRHKNFGDEHEPNIKSMIVDYVRKCMANYNINYKFCMADLLMPSRKKTTAFLNVLIYLSAQKQDSLAILQPKENEHAAKNEAIDELKRERSKLKLEIEELAYMVATNPIEELNDRIKSKELIFNPLQKKCHDIQAKAKHIKDANLKLSENNDQKEAQLESYKREISELEKNLQMRNDGLILEKKCQEFRRILQEKVEIINNLKATHNENQKKTNESNIFVDKRRSNNEKRAKYSDRGKMLLKRLSSEKKTLKSNIDQELSDLSKKEADKMSLQVELDDRDNKRKKSLLQFKTKEQQLLKDRIAKTQRGEEFAQQSETELIQLKKESERLNKERAEEKAKQKEISEQLEIYVEKANRQIEQAASYLKPEDVDTSLNNHINKLESLLGANSLY